MPGTDRSVIRTFAFIPKKSGLSDAEFADYWQRIRPRRSGPFVAPLRIAQSLSRPEAVDASPRLFSAVVEAWDSPLRPVDVQRVLADVGTIYEQAEQFLDVRNVLVLSAEEHIVQMGPAHLARDNILRALWVVRRKPGMSVEAFHKHWRQTHGPMVPRTPSLVRYVQYHVHPELQAAEPPEFDGVAELCWNNLEEFHESWASPQMQEEQFPDMANFLDPTRITGAFFREVWRSDG
jgi:uncharacterized protein (TIGR02118 family)